MVAGQFEIAYLEATEPKARRLNAAFGSVLKTGVRCVAEAFIPLRLYWVAGCLWHAVRKASISGKGHSRQIRGGEFRQAGYQRQISATRVGEAILKLVERDVSAESRSDRGRGFATMSVCCNRRRLTTSLNSSWSRDTSWFPIRSR